MNLVRASSRKSARSSAGSVRSTEYIPSPVDILLKKFVDSEEHELVVYAIREEIIESAMNIIHAKYLKEQCVNFTVHCAHQALLQLLHYHYFLHDPGQPFYEGHPQWTPDLPPIPSPADTWGGYNIPVCIQKSKEDSVEVLLPNKPCGSRVDITDVPAFGTKPEGVSEFAMGESEEYSLTEYEVFSGLSSDSLLVDGMPPPPTSSAIFYEEQVEEEEESDDAEDTFSHKFSRQLSIFTKTAMLFHRESLPQPLGFGFSKFKDLSVKNPRCPKVSVDPLISDESRHKLDIKVDALPPLRAEAKYKPIIEVEEPPPKGKRSKRESKVTEDQ